MTIWFAIPSMIMPMIVPDVRWYRIRRMAFFDSERCRMPGYSMAFQMIMEELGIPCEIVVSDEIKHAWNMVQVDNE